MPDDMPCPPAESLEAFALGRTNDAEAAFVETHLGICPRCVERIASVSADPLLLAVKSGWPVDEDPEDLELAARLRQALPPAELSGTTDGSLQAPTVIHTPGEEQAQSDDTEDWLGIFSSPAESGEIGRLGPYRVLDRLGHGGMGVVFRAEDSRLQRPVALKIMRPRRAASNDSIQRFLAEARAAAALKHDHVVTIYEVGDDGGSPTSRWNCWRESRWKTDWLATIDCRWRRRAASAPKRPPRCPRPMRADWCIATSNPPTCGWKRSRDEPKSSISGWSG